MRRLHQQGGGEGRVRQQAVAFSPQPVASSCSSTSTSCIRRADRFINPYPPAMFPPASFINPQHTHTPTPPPQSSPVLPLAPSGESSAPSAAILLARSHSVWTSRRCRHEVGVAWRCAGRRSQPSGHWLNGEVHVGMCARVR